MSLAPHGRGVLGVAKNTTFWNRVAYSQSIHAHLKSCHVALEILTKHHLPQILSSPDVTLLSHTAVRCAVCRVKSKGSQATRGGKGRSTEAIGVEAGEEEEEAGA